MHFVEQIRVGEEGAKTGFGAKKNRPPAIFGAWIVGGIRIAENPSTKRNKLFMFFAFYRGLRHLKKSYYPGYARKELSHLSDEYFKRTEGQSTRGFGG